MPRVSGFAALGASLVLLAAVQPSSRAGAFEAERSEVVAGSTVDVTLARRRTSDVTPPRSDVVTMAEVAGGGCAVVLFFASTCSVTPKISPLWKGVEKIVRGDRSAAIAWISVNVADSGAEAFMRNEGLPGEPLFVQSSEDLRYLGVTGYPVAYLIGPGGTYLGQIAREPHAIDSLPALCRTRA